MIKKPVYYNHIFVDGTAVYDKASFFCFVFFYLYLTLFKILNEFHQIDYYHPHSV